MSVDDSSRTGAGRPETRDHVLSASLSHRWASSGMASRSGPYDIVARVFSSSCTRASPAGASRTPCRALAFHDITEAYLTLFRRHIDRSSDRQIRNCPGLGVTAAGASGAEPNGPDSGGRLPRYLARWNEPTGQFVTGGPAGVASGS